MTALPPAFRNAPRIVVVAILLALGYALVAYAQDGAPGEPNPSAPDAPPVGETEPEAAYVLPAPGEPGQMPDKVAPYQELEPPAAPSSPGGATFYKFYSANTFVPYDDDMTFVYFGAGCLYRTAGSQFAEINVQLPQGAIVDFLRIYYYDNDAINNASAYLFQFNGLGGFTNLGGASSSGTPGQSFTLSPPINHVVDNATGALAIRLDYGGGTNSNLRICGVRLQYQFALPTLSLPIMLNQTNP